jgi:hypothetical protein
MVSIILSVQTTSERSVILGIYCVIFGLYWRIQLKRTDRWKGILLYPLTASFILCTAYFIITIVQVQYSISVSSKLLFRCHGSQYERRSADFRISQFAVLKQFIFLDDTRWMSVANNGLYTAIDFISQLILVSVLYIQLFSRD